MSKSQGDKRKQYVGMMVVTVLCLVVGLFLLRATVFNKAPVEPEQGRSNEPASGAAPAPAQPANTPAAPTSNANDVLATNTPTAAPANTPPVATSTAPAGTPPAASSLAASGAAISFKDAPFHRASVGSVTERNGYTAVFSERGGTLAVLRYVDKDDKVVYSRTPIDPMVAPMDDRRDQALLLLGPTQTLFSWRYDPDTGETVPSPESAQKFETAFPDEIPTDSALFSEIWNDRSLETDGGDAADEGRAAFGFEGALAWLNTRRWTLESRTAEGKDGDGIRLVFSHTTADGLLKVTKDFQVHPGFKVVCEVRFDNLSSGAAAKTLSLPVSLFGPVGIRQDLFKTQTEYPTALFVARHGHAYEEHESYFGSALTSAFESYDEDAREAGGTTDPRAIPAHRLYDVDTAEYQLMLNGLSNGYFLSVLGTDYLPEFATPVGGSIKRLKGFSPDCMLVAATYAFPTIALEPGKPQVRRTVMYAGPRDKKVVAAAFGIANPLTEKTDEDSRRTSWDAMVSTGWPQFISGPITWLLRWLVELFGGAGLAIIALTIIVRLCIAPLSIKAQKSMQIHGHKMRLIKPKLDVIREKYKGNKAREAQLLQFQETRAVMKANNVSMLPLGGCLILLLQMPIFIALYSSVRTSFLLRHENFLWIEDLARPDALIGSLQTDIMILSSNGFLTLNLLPIIWAALLIIQQRMQPPATDPQQARMQKQMAFIFPLMGLFFYALPAGFTLYFVVSSIYSFVESKLVKVWLVKKGLIDPHAGLTMGSTM